MIQKIKIALLVMPAMVFSMAAAFLAPAISYADCAPTSTDCTSDYFTANQIKLHTTFGFSTLAQALNTIISLIFLVAGLAAFVYILLGAFNYITAGDDSAKTTKARSMITNAVVGLILVALVYVIWLVAINLIPGLNTIFDTTS